MHIQLNAQEGWKPMLMESRGSIPDQNGEESSKGLIWMGMQDLLSLKNSR